MKTSKLKSTPSRLTAAFVLLTALLLQFTPDSALAGNLYWSGNGTTPGGTNTWDTSTAQWGTTASGPFSSTWNNANSDTAIFGGTVGLVTLGTGITNGGLQFNTTGYVITNANTLTFGAANNTITLNNIAAATINGQVGGSGNVAFTAANPTTAGTLTLGLTSTAGWSGATTINPGMTLTLSGANRALNSTAGITLNGGTLSTANTTLAQGAFDRVNNAASITSYGGTISYANSSTAGNVYAETNGSVNLVNGQLNLVETTSMAATAPNDQTLTLSGLARTGAGNASAITFSAATTGPQASGNRNMIVVTGAGTTAAGQIAGPWATVGTAANAQTDYAVYSSDYVTNANIAPTGENSWTVATDAYTMSNKTAGITLTATRNLSTLRNTSTANGPINVDTNSNVITNIGNLFVDGDVVAFGGTPPAPLVAATPYYVINAGVNGVDTFQVASTFGGSAVDLTGFGTSPNVAVGLSLPAGANLGTYGILNGTVAAMVVGGSGGAITLPSSTSSNLYITPGSAQIQIAAPINDNGAGVLTLVKSGSGNLTLRNTNSTYSGGTIINAGTLTYTADTQLGASGSRNITFGGSATLTWGFDSSSLGTLTVNAGAVGTLSSLNSITFASTTGFGTIAGSGGQNKTVSLGDASSFTGNIALSYNANNNSGPGAPHVQFSKLNDAVGSAIRIYRIGGGTDSGQIGQVGLYGNVGAVTFANRQVQILSRPTTTSNPNLAEVDLVNNNTTAANKWVINTPLLNASGRDTTLGLLGGNAGDNEFAGVIGNSIYSASNLPPNGFSSGTGVLSLTKAGTGKWIVSGNNTFSGAVTVSAGTLVGIGTNAFGSSSGISIAAVGTLSLRGDTSTSFVKASDSSPYTVTTSASGATINVDQATVAGTSAKTMTLGNLGTSSTAATYQLNFTGTNNTSLSAGNLNTPVSTSAAVHTINNTIAGGGSLTLSSVSNQATTVASPNLVFAGTGNTIVTGAITQTLADMDLIKNDAGSLTLNGTNTYTGTTTVNAGTLLINGDSSAATGAVTVNGTSTLGGSGTIGGVVTVASGANLAPGASVGTLTITGSLTNSAMAAGAGKLIYELGPTNASDKIVVGGTLAIGSGVLGFSNFTFTALGGLQNGTYTLITSGAAVAGTLDGANLSGVVGTGTGTLQISGIGTDIELAVTGVTGGPGTPSPTLLTNSVSSGTLSLSWPAGQGWRLQQQTNALSIGLRTNWVFVTDSSVSSTNITVDKTKPTVFYRLIYP